MCPVSFWAVWLAICFGWPISYAQLNWISDRKLEKLAWSTWSFHAIVLYELFMKFSEWKIWIGLWIHSIHRKYKLSHLVNILHCFVDTDIAGCVESVHWLKYLFITHSAWHCCWFHPNHQSPSPHGFTGSRLPQHQLSWCCCNRTYAWIISWQNGRLGQYKQVPSLFGSIPSSPYSAPELWVANALTQEVPEMKFYFLRFNYKDSTVSIICMSDL